MSDNLRDEILSLAEKFAAQEHAPRPFKPGVTPVPVSGKVFGAEEMRMLVDASLDFWLTSGRFNDAFEEGLRKFLGVKHALTVNSGSSANLLALASLTSPALGKRALKAGDEVLTVAAAFPTTVNPMLLYGLVPVFVDIEIPTYNVDVALIERAISPKTRAMVFAHSLGNPFDLETVVKIARKHNLWLIEDTCDALGSTYTVSGMGPRVVGTFGDVSTVSFYPAHHITTGEGGAVFTNDGKLKLILASIRDWGRDCFCDPGKDNTCGKRFEWQLGELPFGYDHKYTYSELGYNLKMTDMQAAVGLAQLNRLPDFIAARKKNFKRMKELLKPLSGTLILPEATQRSDPAWFGFPITLGERAGVKRLDLIRHLESKKIATRLVFGGNLTRQPYFSGRKFRVAGDLKNTDIVMDRTFWIGIYPGLSDVMIDYSAQTILDFFKGR